MLNKKIIIFSSLGRTGTAFLANFFSKNFKYISSVHEPGLLALNKLSLKKLIQIKKEYGFYKSFFLKIFGKWDISSLSIKRLSNKISEQETKQGILKARKKYIGSFQSRFYLEANYNYYGLIDLLPELFPSGYFFYIIRDPRNWVRSWLNMKGLYSKLDIKYLYGQRPTPKKVGDANYIKKWPKMNQFERLCWLWNYTNNFITNKAKKTNLIIIKFENLFNEKNDYEYFFNFLSHNIPEIKINSSIKNKLLSSLEEKSNQPSHYTFPHWQKWSQKQCYTLQKHCAPLMNKYEYGREKNWRKAIKDTSIIKN